MGSNVKFHTNGKFKLIFLHGSPGATMAANFTISDSESEPSEDLEEENKTRESASEQMQQHISKDHTLTLPELRMPGKKPEKTMGHYRQKVGRRVRYSCICGQTPPGMYQIHIECYETFLIKSKSKFSTTFSDSTV